MNLANQRHANPLDHTYKMLCPDESLILTDEQLQLLAGLMVTDQTKFSNVPAGYTYFGQLIAHDVSRVSKNRDGNFVPNPVLDLDTIYGGGFHDDAVFIDRRTGHMTLGETTAGRLLDLPRDGRGKAIVADPRNDENLILAQLQTLFLRFHNHIIDHMPGIPGGGYACFEFARRRVVAVYQYIVLHEFLRTLCEPGVYHEVVENRRSTFWRPVKGVPKVPLEFSGAAFRFGHSMVASSYSLSPGTIVTIDDLFAMTGRMGMGGSRCLADDWVLDWSLFLETQHPESNFAFTIDPKVIKGLINIEGDPRSLPLRNLKAGQDLDMASGQAIAREVANATTDCSFNVQVFDQLSQFSAGEYFEPKAKQQELALFDDLNLHESCPLWYYLLAEAWLEPGERSSRGDKLGTLGSLIVAEVLMGLVEHSRSSIFDANGEALLQTTKDEFLQGQNITLLNIVKTLEQEST